MRRIDNCAITNNDNGLRRTAFPLIGLDGLDIDGNGSGFIFHGKTIPFMDSKSTNMRINANRGSDKLN